MKTPIFIKIDGDIFNVSNIQALSYEDKKNELGNDRGVYILHIYMKDDIGTMHKMYADRNMRNEAFIKASDQLARFSICKIKKF